MAKVRVYELAKDLNMTNKQLLDKMKELKIEVKSHMSSLEDSAIRTIKSSLFGSKKKQSDVKVRPSVIRRRKAESAPEPEPSTGEPGLQEEGVTDETAEQRQAEEQDAPKAPEPGVTEAGTAPASDSEDTPEPPVKKAKKKKAAAAKIIKPVSVPEKEPPQEPEQPVEPEKAPVDEIQDEAPAAVEEPAPAKPTEAASQEASDVVQTEPAAQEPVPDVQEGAEETPAETLVETPAETPEDEAQVKNKKGKKKKGSAPAKIVKKADPAVLENIRRMKAEEKASENQSGPGRPAGGQGASPQDMPVPGMMIPDPTDGRKRSRGKDEAPGGDGPGKRKRRKKKSVVEGDALYRGRGRKKRGKKDARGKKGSFQKTQITTPKAIKRRIKIDEAIELAELAKRMGIKANEMIAKLMGMGVMATVNQTIDFDTASLVAAEFNFEVEKASFEEEVLLNVVEEEVEADEDLQECAPVVTIMGHVDHGKTSLLDVIRESKITSGEAGGITQHIGAYNVETPNGGHITFLDTPGHAAFTAMRSRGAKVTDIVILVVAADDGVMPQTIEAINHAKAADVPVVVAVNKMDKAGADPERVMRELSEHGLQAEEWGGSAIFVKVSAKTGEGLDDLLDMVLLQAEVLELRANPDRNATGYVVESRLDTGRGSVATVLVKQGTLKDGDPIVCGLHSGRIRAMSDDIGNRVETAGPATPVEIVGLTGVPDAGDEFIAVASDKDAKQIANHRMQKQRAKELAKKSRANLEKMFANLGTAEVKELKLIVKADVHGSIEALNDSLKDLAKEEVDVKIVHSGAGTINESDVALAGVSDAIIIGFNVRPTPQIRKMAKDEHVDMRFYDIIYDVINDIKAALDGMMPSTFEEIIIGRAEVRDTFVVPKIGTIAGCAIVEGKVVRGKKIRLLRDGVIKCDTELSSLRRFKDDVKQVDQGYECGIGLAKYNDIKIGDAIECYEVEERKYQG
jgi:translation initiation factor IF-2